MECFINSQPDLPIADPIQDQHSIHEAKYKESTQKVLIACGKLRGKAFSCATGNGVLLSGNRWTTRVEY